MRQIYFCGYSFFTLLLTITAAFVSLVSFNLFVLQLWHKHETGAGYEQTDCQVDVATRVRVGGILQAIDQQWRRSCDQSCTQTTYSQRQPSYEYL